MKNHVLNALAPLLQCVLSSYSAGEHLNCIFHFEVMTATSVFGNLPVTE